MNKKRSAQNGIITVMVVLLMVPCVVFTGLFADVARLKFCESQALMGADMYAESVLSVFDNQLKSMYGYFSVAQSSEGKSQIEALDEYAKKSFNPDKAPGQGTLYSNVDAQFEYTPIEESRLTVDTVFEYQTADFMKIRVFEKLYKDIQNNQGGPLAKISNFRDNETDRKVIKECGELGEDAADALKNIEKYYYSLKYIEGYAKKNNETYDAVNLYAMKLQTTIKSPEYADYYYYINNESAIKESIRIVEAYNSADEDDEDVKEPSSKDWEHYNKYKGYNPNTFRNNFSSYVGSVKVTANNLVKNNYAEALPGVSSQSFGKNNIYNELPNRMSELDTQGGKVEKKLRDYIEKVNKIKQDAQGCSDEIKKGVVDDLSAELDKVKPEYFTRTVQLLKDNNAIGNNLAYQDNLNLILDGDINLNNIYRDVMDGFRDPSEGVPDYEDAHETQPWYEIDKGEMAQFCKDLEHISGESNAKKKETQDKIDSADEEKEKYEGKIEDEEKKESTICKKNITDAAGDIQSELGYKNKNTENYKNEVGFSISSIVDGDKLIDKFLLTEYDMGMFSSRVTGISKEANKGASSSDDSVKESGDYADYSYTDFKLCEENNFLYKGELEYIYGGYNDSKKNLGKTRNHICAIRMACNFGSTYTIKEIDSAIKVIGDAALAVPYIGPILQVAVVMALRTAVATAETFADWNLLMKRQDVVFFKSKLDELSAKETLGKLLNVSVSDKSAESNNLKFGYEDYLTIFILLLRSNSDVVERTRNLVTLNVNQTLNGCSSAQFKMSETVTAIEAVGKARIDMVVVPDNMLNLFFKGDASKVRAYDDGYIGYCINRGY